MIKQPIGIQCLNKSHNSQNKCVSRRVYKQNTINGGYRNRSTEDK